MTSTSHGHFVICFSPPIGTHEVKERERERKQHAYNLSCNCSSDDGEWWWWWWWWWPRSRFSLFLFRPVSYLWLNWRVTSARTDVQLAQASNLQGKTIAMSSTLLWLLLSVSSFILSLSLSLCVFALTAIVKLDCPPSHISSDGQREKKETQMHSLLCPSQWYFASNVCEQSTQPNSDVQSGGHKRNQSKHTCSEWQLTMNTGHWTLPLTRNRSERKRETGQFTWVDNWQWVSSHLPRVQFSWVLLLCGQWSWRDVQI